MMLWILFQCFLKLSNTTAGARLFFLSEKQHQGLGEGYCAPHGSMEPRAKGTGLGP